MVLVDSSDESWREHAWRLDLQQRSREDYFAQERQGFEDQRACIRAAQSGFVEGSKAFNDCVPAPEPIYSDAINAARRRNGMSLAYQQASLSELENYQHASTDQLVDARRWYGDMPLIVLMPAPTLKRADEPQSHRDAVNRAHRFFADQLAALSKRGFVRDVPDATHSIQTTRPEAVIEAVLEVVEQARKAPNSMR